MYQGPLREMLKSQLPKGESRGRKKQPNAKPRPNAISNPRRIKAAERQIKAMEMRMAGVSFPKIAKALGYRAVSAAFKAVMSGLRAARIEPAKALPRTELSRPGAKWGKLL